MDSTTQLAIRAIVSGLCRSGAISTQDVNNVATALHEAEVALKAERHGCAAYDLMVLANSIAADAETRSKPADGTIPSC